MPRSRPAPDIETRLCDAALKLAGRHGWGALTVEKIAGEAKTPPAKARQLFCSTDLILPAIVKRIDRQVISGIGKPDRAATAHDRLFEVMMARFDALQAHRAGIIAIMKEARRNPAMARRLLPAQHNSMRKMLVLADCSPKGGLDSVAAAGLLAVYARALCIWQKDNSADMAPTMAALDQALRLADMIGNVVFTAFNRGTG
ncbi:MAG: hypothetical protein AB7H77_12225 [Bdellovibrionales bacterium]